MTANQQQIDILARELEGADKMLCELDANIKTLTEQYAQMVLVVDAFQAAKSLLEEAIEEPDQLELNLN